MKSTESLQKEIYKTLLSRVKEDDSKPPMKHGNYFYYSRTEKGKNYRYRCRKKGSLDASEEIYLDENKEAENLGYYSISQHLLSKDDRFLLLTENTTGSMEYSARIKNLETGEFLPWKISNTTGSVCWCGDFEHIYYIERHPINGRGHKVFQMNIQKGPESKKLIFEKPDELSHLFMGVYASPTHDYIFIDLSDTNSNQIYVMSGKEPQATPQLFWKRQDKVKIHVDFGESLFYILTNDEGYTNNRVFTCTKDQWDRNSWSLLIDHSQNTFIKFFDLFKNHIVFSLTDNKKAIPELKVLTLKNQQQYTVAMKDPAYYLEYLGALEYDSPYCQFIYQSPIQPPEVRQLDFTTEQTEIIKKGECPNFDPTLYQVERVFAEGHDGAEIPLTIVTKKDFIKDGSPPHFQYAYGSYGFSMPAYFSSHIFSLIDRGFSFSIAHIRGGADKGYQWYLDGKLDKKMNTFKDFISCSKYLIDKKYTSTQKITANGGSAGGLLMGAIANMSPELYNSVILDVPFVDVITTISDADLPLTPPEWNEWGNPIKDKKAFEYMMSYSPYDNIAKKDYPHMLFNSGITDEQVTYWEPTKMVAKLRELKTDSNMLLLKMKMTAGHAGSSARYKMLEEKAFSYAFALKAQEHKTL